jgi:ankyrin repeat protein
MTIWCSNARRGRSSALALAATALALAQPANPLLDAVRDGSVERVRSLLTGGADINARDAQGQTALLLACTGSASEYRVIGANGPMVRLLVDRGADVDGHDREGWTPLLKLVNLWADDLPLVEFLVSKGANVNAHLNDGRTALMLAARLGKDDRVRLLLANGADVNARDNAGTTALMVAATIQWDDASIDVMKLLIANRADVNAKDRDGRTAADRAGHAGYLARARLLMDAGTRVDAQFLKVAREFALLRAIERGDTAQAKELLSAGADPNVRADDGRTPLIIAADDEYSAERAILLLEHGAKTDSTLHDGRTALMIAADRYNPEIVKALLDGGANPNAADIEGNSVLMHAAASKYSWQEERKPLVHLLLEKGADAAHRNSRGVTALMLMAREGNPAMPLLFERGAPVDARDVEGNTALVYAARFFVRGWPRRNGWALLQHGANVDAANQRGETPLILAATQFEPDAVNLLLAKHADVNARTRSGRTALMQAIDGPKEFDNDHHVVYSPAIAKALIDAGADVNAKDDAGNTPLSIARTCGYDETITVLQKAGAIR